MGIIYAKRLEATIYLSTLVQVGSMMLSSRVALASSKQSQSSVLLLYIEIQIGLRTVHSQCQDRGLEVVCSNSALEREDARYLRKWETGVRVYCLCDQYPKGSSTPTSFCMLSNPIASAGDKLKVRSTVLLQLAVKYCYAVPKMLYRTKSRALGTIHGSNAAVAGNV